MERGGAAGAQRGDGAEMERQASWVSYAPAPAPAPTGASARSSQSGPADSLDGQEEHDDAGATRVDSANGINGLNL